MPAVLTKKQLIAALADAPDDAPVLAEGFVGGMYGSMKFEVTAALVFGQKTNDPAVVLRLH